MKLTGEACSHRGNSVSGPGDRKGKQEVGYGSKIANSKPHSLLQAKMFLNEKRNTCVKAFSTLLISAFNELDLDYLDVKQVWYPSFMSLLNNHRQSSK